MNSLNKKEIISSAAKSIFGAVPFGGALLDELFFEYNGRIKQKRLNHFVEILAENFTEESEINIDNIKTENFNDLFESVLRRVIQTKSELRLKRFKDILIKELNSPTEQTELVELYLDLISTLSEEELSILYYHRFFDNNYEDEIDKLNKLRDKLNSVKEKQKRETIIIDRSKYADEKIEAENGISKIENWLEPLKKYKTAEFYDLTDNRFMFFKQRLFSKGLLVDNVRNRISGGTFQNMGITEFGIEFIEFIKGKE
jgi:hypothetical protein